MIWAERRRWFRLASHLHCPLQVVQSYTTSTELEEWERYLDEAANDFHREDTFLAQIALEIRRSWVKDPNKPTLEQFMVKFEKRKAVNPAQLEAEEEDDTDDDQPQSKEKDQAERVALSKAFWFAIAGVSEPKK